MVMEFIPMLQGFCNEPDASGLVKMPVKAEHPRHSPQSSGSRVTTTVKVQVDVCPAESVLVTVTTVDPTGKKSPLECVEAMVGDESQSSSVERRKRTCASYLQSFVRALRTIEVVEHDRPLIKIRGAVISVYVLVMVVG